MSAIEWPVKTREMHNHHFNSEIWNDFQPREDDIVISTYAKSGTTWVQQIVSQLLWPGVEGLEVAAMSPWMDLRIPPPEVKLAEVEEQQHRRFLKTHLPVDALRYLPEVKYLYIARDPRDVVWSMHNHHLNANEIWYDKLNNSPGRQGPPIETPPTDVRQYFLEWLEGDGHPWWPYWENLRTWWAIRDLPNLQVLHYANLKADLPNEIRRIADFLDIPIEEDKFDDMLRICSFGYMKENATQSTPLGGIFWEGGAKTFVHKGQNARWKGMLSDEDLARYDAIALEQLGPELKHWAETGEGL